MRSRFVVWRREDAPGMEAVEVELHQDRLRARGVQLGPDYRMDWTLDTSAGWVTERLAIEVAGPHANRLELERADLPAGALDCDLGFCPLTNTMPILRHGLHEGGEPVDFVMAWVSVPDLTVHTSRQRYEPVRPGVVRYRDATFSSELELDDDGLVVRYPGLARREGGAGILPP
jgi:hypothetical protein